MIGICLFLASQILSCFILNCVRKRLARHLNLKILMKMFQAAFQLALKIVPRWLSRIIRRN